MQQTAPAASPRTSLLQQPHQQGASARARTTSLLAPARADQGQGQHSARAGLDDWPADLQLMQQDRLQQLGLDNHQPGPQRSSPGQAHAAAAAQQLQSQPGRALPSQQRSSEGAQPAQRTRPQRSSDGQQPAQPMPRTESATKTGLAADEASAAASVAVAPSMSQRRQSRASATAAGAHAATQPEGRREQTSLEQAAVPPSQPAALSARRASRLSQMTQAGPAQQPSSALSGVQTGPMPAGSTPPAAADSQWHIAAASSSAGPGIPPHSAPAGRRPSVKASETLSAAGSVSSMQEPGKATFSQVRL